MPTAERRQRRADTIQKFFLTLIVLDYIILGGFFTQLGSIDLKSGIMISLLMLMYNMLLTFLCFQRAKRHDDTHILYPTLVATLLAFGCFLYLFFIG